jgi:hypothetical protein
MTRSTVIVLFVLGASACNALLANEPGQPRPAPDADVADAADASVEEASACGAPDDPENCGTCGRSCLGGKCEAGRCLPVALLPEHPDFNGMYGLAVDDTDVFFSNYCRPIGRVFRVSKDGGPFAAVSAPGGAYDCGSELVLDGDSVFFVNHWNRTIMRAKKKGGTTDVVVSGLPHNPQHMAQSASHLFFAQYFDHGLHRVGKDGAGLIKIASGRILSIAIDATHVYFSVEKAGAEPGRLWRANHDGTSPELFGDTGEPADIAIDASDVYWADLKEKKVYRRGKAPGASVLTLSPVLADRPALTNVDATHVYVVEGSFQVGNIVRVPRDGGVPEPLVTGVVFVSRLALDERALYYTIGVESKGAVYKLAK